MKSLSQVGRQIHFIDLCFLVMKELREYFNSLRTVGSSSRTCSTCFSMARGIRPHNRHAPLTFASDRLHVGGLYTLRRVVSHLHVGSRWTPKILISSAHSSAARKLGSWDHSYELPSRSKLWIAWIGGLRSGLHCRIFSPRQDLKFPSVILDKFSFQHPIQDAPGVTKQSYPQDQQQQIDCGLPQWRVHVRVPFSTDSYIL